MKTKNRRGSTGGKQTGTPRGIWHLRGRLLVLGGKSALNRWRGEEGQRRAFRDRRKECGITSQVAENEPDNYRCRCKMRKRNERPRGGGGSRRLLWKEIFFRAPESCLANRYSGRKSAWGDGSPWCQESRTRKKGGGGGPLKKRLNSMLLLDKPKRSGKVKVKS